jgi:hypothetical protein
MCSARGYPARVSGPAPRTNDSDTDERGRTIPQRGRPATDRPQGVDKRCLMGPPSRVCDAPRRSQMRPAG